MARGVHTAFSMPELAPHSLTLAVLRRLADGEFHSGTQIAAQFGLSRARIWQAVAGCTELGVEVFRVRGRGYRAARPLSLLDENAIRAHATHTGWQVRVLDTLASTNTELARSAQDRDIHGEALAVEIQSAGRGRLGRVWQSALGASLTFSLGWRFTQGVGALSGLSLAVGLAMARALDRFGARDVKLKWPNDLLCEGRKLGGILIEVQGDALGPSTAIIGIGLNVRDAARLAREVGQPIADLSDAGLVTVDRNRLLAVLLDQLAVVLEGFARDGFAPFHNEWNARDAYRERRVRLARTGAPPIEGTAAGVDAEGALVVDTHRGRERFVSGELSLRSATKHVPSAPRRGERAG